MRSEVERLAFRQAAMAVTERYVGGGPVFVTMAICDVSPSYTDDDHCELAAGTVPYAAVLTERWLRERPGGDMPPIWDGVGFADGDDSTRLYVDGALEVLKDHWPEVVATARALLRDGWAELAARPDQRRPDFMGTAP